jgi:hypothetical protein
MNQQDAARAVLIEVVNFEVWGMKSEELSNLVFPL